MQAEVLAKLYIARQDYGAAAGVYAALASRRSAVGDDAVTLDQRSTAFQCAFLQVLLNPLPPSIPRGFSCSVIVHYLFIHYPYYLLLLLLYIILFTSLYHYHVFFFVS